jgi:hypothetical protein
MWEFRRFRAKKDDYKERLDENGKRGKTACARDE